MDLYSVSLYDVELTIVISIIVLAFMKLWVVNETTILRSRLDRIVKLGSSTTFCFVSKGCLDI